MSAGTSGRRGERGVTLVFMAISIVMVLGTAAIVIDYAKVKAEIAEAQRAVDAAALAGASVYRIPFPPGARDTALKYGRLQSVGGDTILPAELDPIDQDDVEMKVTVTFQRSGIKTWFANVLGEGTVGIKAIASAQMQIGPGDDTTLVLIK